MDNWPALMVAPDMFQQSSNLNGRRWSGSALLESWAAHRSKQTLHLACADTSFPEQLTQVLDHAGHQGSRVVHGLLHPEVYGDIGGLFIPDPSLGLWSRWRQRCGAHRFSLIGQIHTLSTPAAARSMEGLITEPVQPWDALICSSTAGRDVVNAVLNDREEWMQRRFGSDQAIARPQLPVIPLPVRVKALQQALPSRTQARQQLGLPADASVCLWLGRLSLFTKLDPWTQYRVLNQVAQQLPQELWLIECGPDDSDDQRQHFERLRALCPALKFRRLGGAEAVPEAVKWQALAAANVGISLVDNCQETFGLSIVEAMAAGLPMLVSDWDGYKDLVRHGVDGFRVPSRWLRGAGAASEGLAWAQELGLQSYPGISGALAQLIALDADSAVAMLLILLLDPHLAEAMGRQGQRRMGELCEAEHVMERYGALFAELQAHRQQAQTDLLPAAAPRCLNPIDLFRGYASSNPWTSRDQPSISLEQLPEAVRDLRGALWWEVLRACSNDSQQEALRKSLVEKHL